MCGDAASFASLEQRSTNACAAHVVSPSVDVLAPGGRPAAARARPGADGIDSIVAGESECEKTSWSLEKDGRREELERRR